MGKLVQAIGAKTRATLSLALVGVLITACSSDPPPQGGLVIVVESDLALPKDIDRLRIEVTQQDKSLLSREQDLGPSQPLPAEFRIGPTGNDIPVLVRAIGYHNQQPAVERSALTPVPAGYTGLLRVPLNYLCEGQVNADGSSSCDIALTCKQGECTGPEPVPAELPAYESESSTSPASSGNSDAAGQACFDVLGCLRDAKAAVIDPTTCSFALQPGANPAALNIGLQLASGGAGSCTEAGCWVALEAGDEGWTVEGSNVVLPKALCSARSGQSTLIVVSSTACPTKDRWVPLCQGDTSNVGPETPGIVAVVPPPTGNACEPPASEACGFCGTRTRDCENGSWSVWNACKSEGTCTPNETRGCGSGGQETCGGNCLWGECRGQRCAGADTQACGNCGTQKRTCNDASGGWSEWSACSDEGECKPNDSQTCGVSGSRVCGGACHWGDCTNQVCTGPASQACGMCGTQARSCDSGSATWGEWAACGGEGECAPNQTRTCGANGMQTCGGNCRWGTECSGQTCTGPVLQTCGNCGMQTRTCDMNTGKFSDWTTCTNEGSCQPNETRGCGMGGTQSCGGNCQWNATCAGQMCTGPSTRVCGNCGAQTRSCDTSRGTWSDWSACTGQGACEPNQSRSCGTGGTQLCRTTCQWETTCAGQECSAPLSQTCGSCGRQTRTCDTATGTPSAWSACMGQGACAPQATRTCGSNGTQTCTASCAWGTDCVGQTCSEPAMRSCGNCGVQTSTCNPSTGKATWSACGNEKQCSAGATRTCGGRGTQTCSTGCDWGGCDCGTGQQLCGNACTNIQTDDANCGKCGTSCGDGQSCQAGKCVTVCKAPEANCSGNTCTNTDVDSANCGRCGNACANGSMCVGGRCMIVCGPGQMLCGNTCVNLQTDGANCGTCGNACTGSRTCQSGSCRLPCQAPAADCGGASCANLQTDGANCGRCGRVCGAGTSCQAGECVIACNPPAANCGGACADLQNDNAHCGSCERVCGTGTRCQGGDCVLVCNPPAANCGGKSCADLQNDNGNCGSCGHVCSAGTSCQGGECACGSGTHACGGSCVSNNSIDTCGPTECNTRCPAPSGGSAGCDGNRCTSTCDASVPNLCGGNTCVNFKTDAAHCGDCQTACGGGESCVNGACSLVCGAGQIPCDGKCINANSDDANCGRCGNKCDADKACSGGTCGCKGEKAQCGNLCVNPSNDHDHCGGCDIKCGEAEICASNECKCADAKTHKCGTSGCFAIDDVTHCGPNCEQCKTGETCNANGCVAPQPPPGAGGNNGAGGMSGSSGDGAGGTSGANGETGEGGASG